MSYSPNIIDPVPPAAYPALQGVATAAPAMPSSWNGVALLHPFSPPQSNNPSPNNPFFQLCVANLTYVAGTYFSAQIAGVDHGSWWYVVTPVGTQLSIDQGNTWSTVDMGWSLPDNWFGGQLTHAACAGASRLNWMPGPTVDWWKVPVPATSGDTPAAATWMWFDSSSAAPVRMMFGQGPLSTDQGDPTQLALFQMYSMSYLPVFSEGAPAQPPPWEAPVFPGFQNGNPAGYQTFQWNGNFGMTAFMTPVNEQYNPLATRILYVWKPDAQYALFSDRAQHTKMLYEYSQPNPGSLTTQIAILTGPAPVAIQPAPAQSATSYDIQYTNAGGATCAGPSRGFDFPQEPPDWMSLPAINGVIHATINNNPVVSPGATVLIYSALFPPSGNNYPDSTYLWTWYSPLDASGIRARPVTFMQSQSGVNLGTSLALADYFFYEEFETPIDPGNFAIPAICEVPE